MHYVLTLSGASLPLAAHCAPRILWEGVASLHIFGGFLLVYACVLALCKVCFVFNVVASSALLAVPRGLLVFTVLFTSPGGSVLLGLFSDQH